MLKLLSNVKKGLVTLKTTKVKNGGKIMITWPFCLLCYCMNKRDGEITFGNLLARSLREQRQVLFVGPVGRL